MLGGQDFMNCAQVLNFQALLIFGKERTLTSHTLQATKPGASVPHVVQAWCLILGC